jgi:chromosome segregation ATPase
VLRNSLGESRESEGVLRNSLGESRESEGVLRTKIEGLQKELRQVGGLQESQNSEIEELKQQASEKEVFYLGKIEELEGEVSGLQQRSMDIEQRSMDLEQQWRDREARYLEELREYNDHVENLGNERDNLFQKLDNYENQMSVIEKRAGIMAGLEVRVETLMDENDRLKNELEKLISPAIEGAYTPSNFWSIKFFSIV